VADPTGKLRWILKSPTESYPIQNGLRLTVYGDEALFPVPLAEGRYVLPFPKAARYEVYTWYDHDRRIASVRNWLGGQDTSPEQYGDHYYSFSARVEDEHCAVDYVFQYPVPVIASDAGEIWELTQVRQDEYIVLILNEENVRLNYGHVNIVDDLQLGSRVSRGDVIGYATAHTYPSDNEPVFQGFDYMIHQGFEPLGMGSHCDALDPFSPNLWTSSDYNTPEVSTAE
jgi:hypothetical protein